VTRGTRPKKPSSSRGFAHEARGARGVWGLKTENRKLKIENWKNPLFFQAGNNYQKKFQKNLFFLFIFYFFRPRGRGFYRVRGR
jgi:hypothetical protein